MDKIEEAQDRMSNENACSQAILTTYAKDFSLDEELALRLTAGFAGGMRMARTCGAITGAYMVLGLKFGDAHCGTAKGRRPVYAAVKELTDEFVKVHGSVECRELLGCNISTRDGMRQALEGELFRTLCPQFVRTVSELLEVALTRD